VIERRLGLTKAAPAKLPRLIQIDKSQLESKFSRALLVDDDLEYGESISQNLISVGMKTDVVDSLAIAFEVLTTSAYPIVFVDNIFEDRPELRGSEFIRDQERLLDNSEVVLMTGYAINQIVDQSVLGDRGVHIVQKAPGHIDVIKALCLKRVKSQVDQLTESLENFCESMLERIDNAQELEGLIPEPRLMRRARNHLFNYLSSLPNTDTEQFYFEGNTYTPKHLAAEVSKGSRTGALLLDLFLEDVLAISDEDGESIDEGN
jgi:ActR/RegA family two-component response regulator